MVSKTPWPAATPAAFPALTLLGQAGCGGPKNYEYCNSHLHAMNLIGITLLRLTVCFPLDLYLREILLYRYARKLQLNFSGCFYSSEKERERKKKIKEFSCLSPDNFVIPLEGSFARIIMYSSYYCFIPPWIPPNQNVVIMFVNYARYFHWLTEKSPLDTFASYNINLFTGVQEFKPKHDQIVCFHSFATLFR